MKKDVFVRILFTLFDDTGYVGRRKRVLNLQKSEFLGVRTMTTTNNTSDGNNEQLQVSCRVAYMLDDDQPVLCTLIGDQPLFYADEMAINEIDDDAFEDDFESTGDLLFRLTTEDLQARAIKMEEKRQAFVDDNKPNVYDLFAANAASLSDTKLNQEITISHLTTILEKSRLGAELLRFAQDNAITLSVSSDTDCVIYDRDMLSILVPSFMEEGTALVGLAQELRRAFQHKQGTLINPVTFAVEDAITVNRAQIADLCVSKIRIAWELSLTDEKSAWEAIAASGLSDIAFSMVREVKNDFRSLNNGWAMQVGFEKWFLSDRCKLEDRRLIQTMLADHGGHVFETDELSHMVSIEVVTRLGHMPFGKNYLSNIASNIVHDPLYTEVRDRSSANFLWFIKFESAFRDKERDLKTPASSAKMPSSVRATLFGGAEEEETKNNEEGYCEVIAFPSIFADIAEQRQPVLAARGNNIVQLFAHKDR